MATQAEITARLEQAIANQREVQRQVKAATPAEAGAAAVVAAEEEEATS